MEFSKQEMKLFHPLALLGSKNFKYMFLKKEMGHSLDLPDNISGFLAEDNSPYSCPREGQRSALPVNYKCDFASRIKGMQSLLINMAY